MRKLIQITFIILTLYTISSIHQNNIADFKHSVISNLTGFSVESNMSPQSASEQIMYESNIHGYDILIEDTEYINQEYWIVYYKTNNTDDFLSIETSKKSTYLAENEYFSNNSYTIDGQHYNLYTTTNDNIVILPYEKFIERNKDVSSFILYCKTAEKNKIYSSLIDAGFNVTEYNDFAYSSTSDSSMLIIPAFVFLLSIMLYTIHNAKKCTLMKMDGFSIWDITIYEILTQLPFYTITIILGLIISFIYTKYSLNVSLPDYLKNGMTTIKTFVYVLTISVIIRLVFNTVFCKIKYIKGAVHGNIMYFATSIVKTFSLVYLTLLISNVLSVNVLPAFNEYKTVLKCSEKYKDFVYFTQVKGGFEQSELSEDKLEPRLIDFYLDSVKNYDVIICNTYPYLNDENGKPLYLINSNNGFGPKIYVNNNYIDKNEIFDMNNNLIDSSYLDSDCLTILIPDNYKWSTDGVFNPEYFDISSDFKYKFVTYDSNKSSLFAYLPEVSACYPYGELSPAPAIFCINKYSLNASFLRKEVLVDILYGRAMYHVKSDNPKTELSPLFTKYNCEDIVDGIVYLEDTMNEQIEEARSMFIRTLVLLSLFIILLLVVSIFTVSYYCQNNRMLIAMRGLDGFSFIKTFKMHIAVMAFEYLILVISIHFMSIGRTTFIIPYVVGTIFIIIDIIVNVIRCKLQVIKNIYKISKGEM